MHILKKNPQTFHSRFPISNVVCCKANKLKLGVKFASVSVSYCTSQRAADIRKTSNSARDGDTLFSTSRMYICLHKGEDKEQNCLRQQNVGEFLWFSCHVSETWRLFERCHTRIPVTPLLTGNIPILPESDQSGSVPVNEMTVHNEPVLNVQQHSVQKLFCATDHQSP